MNLRRTLRWSVFAALMTGLLLISVGAALLYSQAGAQWAWSRIAQASGGQLSVQSLEGTIAGGLSLRELRAEAPGLVLQSDRTRLSVVIEWLPLRLVIPSLEVETLEVIILDPPDEQDAEILAEEASALPLDVFLQRAQVKQLLVRDARGEALFEPLQLEFSALIAEQLAVPALSARGDSLAVEISGEVMLREPFPHRFEGRLTLPEPWAKQVGLKSSAAKFGATGDSSLTELSLSDGTGQFSVRADLRDWLTAPAWELTLEGSDLTLAISAIETARIDSIDVRAQGDMQAYRFNGTSEFSVTEQASIQTEFEGLGDKDGLTLNRARLETDVLDLGLSGTARWQPEPEIAFDLDIQSLELRPWISDWPDGFPVQGKMNVFWRPGVLEADNLSLSIIGTQASMAGAISWRTDIEKAQGQFNWAGIQWPITGETPSISSQSGSVMISGQPDDWQLEGQLDLKSGGYPPGKVHLSGGGDLNQARLGLNPAEVLGGKVTGTLAVDWREALTWQADLDSREIDLSQLWPQWPAVLNAQIHLEGVPDNEFFSADVKQLEGTYDGDPLRGSGKISFQSGVPAFGGVSLRAAGSILELDGKLASQAGLRFKVDASRPGLLAELAGAEVEGSGVVSHHQGAPWTDLDLKVRHMQQTWGEIDEVSLQGDAGPGRPNASLVIAVGGLRVGEQALDSATLVLSNLSGAQHLEIEAVSGEQQLEAETMGLPNSWDSLDSFAWSGEITKLHYTLRDKNLLSLLRPAKIYFSEQALGTEHICFQVAETGQACLEADWNKTQELQVSAELLTIPLGPLVDLMDTDIRMTQALDGTITWSHRMGQKPSGSARVRLSPGLVERVSDDRESARTDAGEFGFQLESGQLSQGLLKLPFPELGNIEAEFGIADLALDGTGQLSGNTRIFIEDLSLLEVFIPGLENLAGRLSVEAQLGGVTADPHLDGTVLLEHGRLDVPALGLENLMLELGGEVNRNDQLSLSGSVRSGSGTGALNAHLDIGQWDAPRFEITLRGENLTMVDVPSILVEANPDFTIGWAEDTWSLNGHILVPNARISPNDSGASVVNESSDVEIVTGQLPAGPEPRTNKSVPLTGKIQLILGDQVSVTMPAVEIKATGEVEMVWQGALVPMANGQILLDGEVRTFGPRLTVEQGRVRFQDRPLDNPELEIRAEREVFGNTQIQTAGVRIGGTARRPSVEAYTNPLTTEERAWTLLVTGSDFEYGQGVGAFDIGTYIAPRLYISYGISLFDDERMVSARYDLKRGFGVKATSSQNDNGVDISYTIER